VSEDNDMIRYIKRMPTIDIYFEKLSNWKSVILLDIGIMRNISILTFELKREAQELSSLYYLVTSI